eukprot:6471600-Amphidinium_carterae.1
MDAGPENMVAKHHAYSQSNLLGTFKLDVSHRRHNAYREAADGAGIGFAMEDMALIASIGSSPWRGCGHFCRWRDAAEEFCINFGVEDELFQLLLPYMSQVYHHGVAPAEWAEAEQAQELYEQFRASHILHFKGERAKLGRWFQSPSRWRSVAPQCGFLCLAIVYIGLHQGWIRSLADSAVAKLCSDETLQDATDCPRKHLQTRREVKVRDTHIAHPQ